MHVKCCYERCPQPSVPEPDLLRCARCRQTAYCSSACQRADWRAGHRDTCSLDDAASAAVSSWQSPEDLPWPQLSFPFSPDELDDRLPEVLRHLQQHHQQLLAFKLKGILPADFVTTDLYPIFTLAPSGSAAEHRGNGPTVTHHKLDLRDNDQQPPFKSTWLQSRLVDPIQAHVLIAVADCDITSPTTGDRVAEGIVVQVAACGIDRVFFMDTGRAGRQNGVPMRVEPPVLVQDYLVATKTGEQVPFQANPLFDADGLKWHSSDSLLWPDASAMFDRIAW